MRIRLILMKSATKLSIILQHQHSITCGLCKHHTMLKVANLIAVVGGDTTTHEKKDLAALEVWVYGAGR